MAAGAASGQHTNCGTPLYKAPEVRTGGEYSTRADVYSLVVVLCEICTSKRARCRPQTEEFNKLWNKVFKILCNGSADIVVPIILYEHEKIFTPNVFPEEQDCTVMGNAWILRLIWSEVPSLIVSLLLGESSLVERMWHIPRVSTAISSRPELVSCLLSQRELFAVDFFWKNDIVPPWISGPHLEKILLGDDDHTPHPFLLHQNQIEKAQKWLEDLSSKFFCAQHPRGPTSSTVAHNKKCWRSRIDAFQKAFGTSATATLRDRLLAIEPHAGEWFATHRKAVGLPETDD